MNARLQEKLQRLGLLDEPSARSTSTPKASASSKQKQLTFRIFFPLPPFEGSIRFNALKAGATYNFTGLLLGVGGRQLQRIKQQSHSRIEIVNAQGNLQGTHPDPLDVKLHALVAADNMAHLQKAVDLVVEVLSPTNASYAPFKVEAGGSTRLVVVAASRGKAGATKPKLSKLLQQSISSKPRSLNGSSSSKGTPASPALTPITPAGGSRHGSMFAPGSTGPNSCSSSRAHTPSPSMHSSISRGVAEPSVLQLPPPALQTLLAAEEWPALPSNQDIVSSSKQPGAGASTPEVVVSGADRSQAGCCNAHPAAGEPSTSVESSTCSTCTACCPKHQQVLAPAGAVGVQHLQPQHTAALAHSEAAGSVQAGIIQTVGNHSASAAVGSDTASEHAMLSPVTPQQQHQHQQVDRLGACSQFGSGDAASTSISNAFAPGPFELDGGSSSSSAGVEHAGCGFGPAEQGQVQLFSPMCPPKPCDLDLLMLRQRAGLVSQACLHCDSAHELPAHSSAACASCADAQPAAVRPVDSYGGGGACMSLYGYTAAGWAEAGPQLGMPGVGLGGGYTQHLAYTAQLQTAAVAAAASCAFAPADGDAGILSYQHHGFMGPGEATKSIW